MYLLQTDMCRKTSYGDTPYIDAMNVDLRAFLQSFTGSFAAAELIG